MRWDWHALDAPATFQPSLALPSVQSINANEYGLQGHLTAPARRHNRPLVKSHLLSTELCQLISLSLATLTPQVRPPAPLAALPILLHS